MADNKNIKLNDEVMAKATGGYGEESPSPRYGIGSQVIIESDPGMGAWTVNAVKEYTPEDGWLYDIECNNHAGYVIEFYEKDLIPA